MRTAKLRAGGGSPRRRVALPGAGSCPQLHRAAGLGGAIPCAGAPRCATGSGTQLLVSPGSQGYWLRFRRGSPAGGSHQPTYTSTEPTGPGPLGAIKVMIAGEDRVLRDGVAAPVRPSRRTAGERRPGATPWTSGWSRLLLLGSALLAGAWCGRAVGGFALRRHTVALLVARRVSARGATQPA